MDTEKQVIERLNQANNVLLTVSANPSVDQLAACIGLSLALNKLGKHATAVFSGGVPSTIEFLKPEETIEKNTDSLRDFIISLDKSKADKLRYKVEDAVVKIFITPYKTSISDADLEFSQGDFNVDVVLAIGVNNQKDLDQAVTAHGRILHDATVVTVNNQDQGNELGTIHWLNTEASSLSEMTALLATGLSQDVFDEQIATAFLTGIVAETDRFRNEKTSANTMNISASLMAAGANQQLVASKLEEPEQPKPEDTPEQQGDGSEGGEGGKPASDAHISKDGTLEINHDNDKLPEAPDTPAEETENQPKPEPTPDTPEAGANEVNSNKRRYNAPDSTREEVPFTSTTDPNSAKKEPHIDPLALPPVDESAAAQRDHADITLEELEKEVGSPHLNQAPPTPAQEPVAPQPPAVPAPPPKPIGEELNLEDLKRPKGLDEPSPELGESIDAARDAVAAAMSDVKEPLKPAASLNAVPLGEPLHPQPPQPQAPPVPGAPENNQPPSPPSDQLMTMPVPPQPGMPAPPPTPDQPEAQNSDDSAPPVPPPIVPPLPGQ